MNKQGESTPFDKIKGKKFFLFEDIDVYQAFFLSELFFNKAEILPVESALYILEIKMKYFICKNLYKKSQRKKSNITLAYSHFFFRFDSVQKFSNLADNFEKLSYVKAITNTWTNDFVVDKNIKSKISQKFYEFILYKWKKVLLTCNLTEEELLYVLTKLCELQLFLKNFNKRFLKKQKLVVVYYDQTPTECALVQRCKKLGIKTATLQHGSAFYKTDKDFAINKFSDYMLVWNLFTQQQLLKIDPKLKNTQILGIPIYFNYENKDINFNENKRCCFFTDTIENDFGKDENWRAICTLKAFCKKNGYCLDIKVRPLEDSAFFEQFIDDYTNIFLTEETILDIAMKYDFCIAISTTVFEELAYLKLPIVRFADVSENGYSEIFNVAFKTVKQLEDIVFNKAYLKAAIEENHKLFGCDNSKAKYTKFFENFSSN